MPQDERTPGAASLTPDDEVVDLLARGEMEVLGLLPRASNHTFLARVSDPTHTAPAVYKPRDGEVPLWDFPEGTLCLREAAAYETSRALGWPRVPPTVLRDGPRGPGSVQLFVEFDPREHYFTMQRRRPDDFRRIALFDVVANNADRKSGHCLLSSDGEVFVVDHGVCFHETPKLRTVIWDFVGEEIPEALLDDLRRLAALLSGGRLRDSLAALLSSRELEAIEARTERAIGEARFPEPGPGRPYPWPVV